MALSSGMAAALVPAIVLRAGIALSRGHGGAGRELALAAVEDREIRLARAAVPEARVRAVRERITGVYPEYDPDRHRIVLVNPNAGDLLPQRRWMPDHFLAVIQRVLERYDDALVLITGTAREAADAQVIRSRAGHQRCINFCGRVEFVELPALYNIARVLLTNDSGPGHFSAVTDLPTVVLFGPETPCRDNVCMQVITPERVFASLREILDDGDGASP